MYENGDWSVFLNDVGLSQSQVTCNQYTLAILEKKAGGI